MPYREPLTSLLETPGLQENKVQVTCLGNKQIYCCFQDQK